LDQAAGGVTGTHGAGFAMAGQTEVFVNEQRLDGN
jgi:hypothetical protein